MQSLVRGLDTHSKPVLPEVHKPSIQLAHPAADTGVTALGPGGGSAESLTQTFGGMFGDGHAQALAGAQAGPAAAVAKPDPGLFPGVTDLTKEYGALANGKRASTQGVVLHRTESSTAKSSLDGYKERIKAGSHVGAQYLIDEKGAQSLVTPLDGMASHSKGFSASTVGVEVVGPAKSLDRTGKKGSIRDQITGLNLSPEMKARLLGYDDKKLGNVAKWNGDQIYEDISGAQKRSVWNLSNQLATHYGLDMTSLSEPGKDESGANHYTTSNLPDFNAHEHINPKAMGEAEPMIEFLRARQQYPQLVDQASKKLAALQASGGDPAQIAKYQALVAQESGTLSSLKLDGNAAEMQALKAEQTAGKPGEASAREHQRTDFYDHFYDRIGALKGAVK